MPPRRSARRAPTEDAELPPPPPPPTAAAEPPPSDDPPPSPSTSSGSDFAGVDVSDADAAALDALEARVADSPLDAGARVSYLTLLQQCGLKARLADARAAAAAAVPLPEAAWLDWVRDEAAAGSSLDTLTLLHAAATADFVSVPLWASWLRAVRERDADVASFTDEGLARHRELAGRALAAAGLHVGQGHILWDEVRSYEDAALAAGAGGAAQADRVRSLWHRQLATPLAGNASSGAIAAATAWEAAHGGGGLPGHVTAAAAKAAAAATARAASEAAVAADAPDADRLAAHLAYVRLEEGTKDPARVLLAWERALAAFPNTPYLWLRAGRAASVLLPAVPAASASIFVRGSRNCPAAGELWARAARAAERRDGGPSEAVLALLDAADAAPLATAEERVEVALCRLDALRRAGGDAALAGVRAAFAALDATLASRFPAYTDPDLLLPPYRARCELELGGGEEGAGRVWEGAAAHARYSGRAKFWTTYALEAAETLSIDVARGALRKGLTRKLDGGPPSLARLAAAWLRLERERGSAADYAAATLKCDPALDAAATAAAASTPGAAAAAARAAGALDPAAVRAARRAADPNYRPKREAGDGASGERAGKRPRADGPPHPRSRDATPSTDARPPRADDGEKRTVFVRGLPADATAADLVATLHPADSPDPAPTVRLPVRPDGTLRGIAYVEFATPAGAVAAVARDGVALRGAALAVALSQPPAPRPAGGRGGFAGGRGRGRDRVLGGGFGRGGGGRGAPAPAPRVGSAPLLPRALAGRGAGGSAAAPKSNADFRAMLLGGRGGGGA